MESKESPVKSSSWLGFSVTGVPKLFKSSPNIQKGFVAGVDAEIERSENPVVDTLSREVSRQHHVVQSSTLAGFGQSKSTEGIQDIQNSVSSQTVNDQIREPFVGEQEEVALLWDRAYECLKEHNPYLVDEYEMIVSAYLVRKEDQFDHTNRISQTDTMVRRIQHTRALEIWMKDVGEEMGGMGPSNAPPRARSLREVMKGLVRQQPHAPLAWLAICLGAEAIMHQSLQPSVDRSPVISVVSKMAWYLALPKLIPNEKMTDNTSNAADKRAGTFRLGIIELYKAILHIGIYSTRSLSEYFPLLGHGTNPDNSTHYPYQYSQPDAKIEGLQGALAAALISSEVEPQLNKVFGASHLQNDGNGKEEDNDLSSTEKLIGKLHVTYLPLGGDWGFLHDFSQWPIDTADTLGLITRGLDQILWVTGDDTSKTIFLRSVVQQLLHAKPKSASHPETNIAYHFCDSELESQGGKSASIVRSLIWQVLRSQHTLSTHLKDKLSITEMDGLNHSDDFYALSTLLCTMIQNEKLNITYFVLDGLEELCGETLDETRDPYRDEWGLTDIVRLIGTTSQLSKRVRWLVSTKNVNTRIAAERLLDIEFCRNLNVLSTRAAPLDLLGYADDDSLTRVDREPDTNHNNRDPHCTQGHIKISLLTHDSIRYAVDEYISSKVCDMAKRAQYDRVLQLHVASKLQTLSEGNLLWVNLACGIIESEGVPRNAPHILAGLKRDVSGLYGQMQATIQGLEKGEKEFCNRVLSTASIVFYPLSLLELAELIKLPGDVNLKAVIGKMCFTFLKVIRERVCFKHSTARDYLRQHMKDVNVLSQEHARMVMQCLDAALNRSQQYSYSKLYWIRHLSAIEISHLPSVIEPVNKFLTSHFLEWLEALASQRLLKKAQIYLQILVATWAEKGIREIRAPLKNEYADILALAPLLRNIQGAVQYIDFHYGLHGQSDISPRNTLLFCPRSDIFEELLPFDEKPIGLTAVPITSSGSHRYNLSSQVLREPLHWVVDCEYSPDERLVASVYDDGSLRVWDSMTGRVQHVILHIPRAFPRLPIVVFSPRSRGIIAIAGSSTVQLWHVATGTPANKLLSTSTTITYIEFSLKGDHLIAITSESVVRWHLPSYEKSEWRILEAENDFGGSEITRACFNSNQHLLASALSPRNEIVIWYMEQYKTNQRLVGHNSAVRSLSFSPDSVMLASSDYDTLKLWNIKNGQLVKNITTTSFYPPRCVAFSPDGLWLACPIGRRTGTIHLWKAVSLTPDVKQYEKEHILEGHEEVVMALRFSRDSRHILSASHDRTIRVWPLDGVTPNACQSQIMADSQTISQTLPTRHNGPVISVAFSADGKIAASISNNGDILLWDADKRIVIRAMENDYSPSILSPVFSQDGSRLISVSRTYDAVIWHTSSGEMVRMLDGYRGKVLCVAISPDSRFIASGLNDGTTIIWKVENYLKSQGADTEAQNVNEGRWVENEVLPQGKGHVHSVAFSPDGRYLASGRDESRVLVWDLNGLKTRHDDGGGKGQPGRRRSSRDTKKDEIQYPFTELKDAENLRDVCGLAFALPDGDTLFSVSKLGVLCVWKRAAVWSKILLRTHQWQLISSFNGADVWPNKPFRSLRFDAERPHVLLCENGVLLEKGHSYWKKASQEALAGRAQYGLIENDEGQTWITRNDEKLIFLPPLYARDDEVGKYAFEVQGNRVIIGCKSGEVLIFKFGETDGIR
ncbi:hypothetical protein GGR51DRAFT_573428 [Nemania sp. FL0031]|nr:hypothetical protein GGR51DRAFT_573428 [Nemania sp. FL0031]